MSEVRAYLEQYRTDMAFVIADERTTQRVLRQTPDVHGPHALIYDLQMRPAAVEGELVVEQGTGRIHRTVLKGVLVNVNAELTTVYEHSSVVNLMVPTLFREHYEDGVDHSGRVALNFSGQYESIACESRYTNFRQFKATSRIK